MQEGQIIRIDYNTALEKAGVVESLADEVNSLLKDLVNNVESNIGNASVWTGNSANDFKSAWDKCAADFDSYVNHIKTIRNQMEETHRQVSAFDNGGASGASVVKPGGQTNVYRANQNNVEVQ